MKKVLFALFTIVSLAFTSCAVSSYVPELSRKETVIIDIYFTETPGGIVQTVECEDGHVAYLNKIMFSSSDIGSEYVYYYPSELETKNSKDFLECDILSIKEENGELVSKLLVTYEDDSSEYYELYMPGYIYENISISGQINLTQKEFNDMLKYNIKNNKIES